MGAVHFYLKKAEESTGKSLIYLKYKYNGYVLVWTFGQSIDPKNWNPKKERVKSNSQTTADGDYSLNDLLDNLVRELESAYKKELANGIPQPETLKRYLVGFMNKNAKEDNAPTLYSLIDRFISGEIKHRGSKKVSGTLAKYKTVKGHLQAFEAKTRYKVDFDTINLDFFYKYVTYLESVPKKDREGNVIRVGLGQNTIAKNIKILKVFLNEALDLGYTNNIQHKNKKFTVASKESDATYLTDAEIIRLYKYDLSENKRLEQVRDLFVFGCFVGLRFSDYADVKPENIVKLQGERKEDLFIRIVPKKTGKLVVIPCNPIVLQIFDKYTHTPNRLPKAISNQKFNAYLKEVCQAAEFTEKGRLHTDPDKELWECITSHTARRSFATNLYLDSFM